MIYVFTSRLSRGRPIRKLKQIKQLLFAQWLDTNSATNPSIIGRPHQHCQRISISTSSMAKSKFEYVRQFESDDKCLPNCWIVIRIDGKGFHRFVPGHLSILSLEESNGRQRKRLLFPVMDNCAWFSEVHHFVKPNDERSLQLMSKAAQTVMEEFKELVLAYGQSDEYSFVFRKSAQTYNRRASKLMTNLVSLFSSSYVFNWHRYFSNQDLEYPPAFDARVILYPMDQNLRDYLSWRQADCHINNLYNTCFWKLIQEKGMSPSQAQDRLKGTLSSDKNELLFGEFGLNYNTLPELSRKGTVIIRQKEKEVTIEGVNSSPSVHRMNSSGPRSLKSNLASPKSRLLPMNVDIIGQKFWLDHPEILAPR